MGDYGLAACETALPYPYPTSIGAGSMATMPTLKQRLDSAVTHAEERLAAVKEARELFDRNPDLEKLLNLMQKGLF